MHPILQPVVTLAGLTALVWIAMYVIRLTFLFRHNIPPQRLHTREAARELLAPVSPIADNFQNLLEVPVLFYALVTLLLVTGTADPRFTQLAWAYVLLRVLHTAIHVTYNRVVHRFAAYVVSCLILAVMWIRFAWMIYTPT